MCDIWLQAAGLNEWLDAVEQKLTLTGDMLDVVEVEAEQLKGVWISEAGEIWKAEFQIRMREMRARLAEMRKIILSIGEIGKILADQESNIILGAEKL